MKMKSWKLKTALQQTCIENPLLDAVLSAMPELPRLNFILGAFLFAEHQHHDALQSLEENTDHD